MKERQELSTVWLSPCPSFRIPLHGDLFTCADCGYWISDHEPAEEVA